MTDITNHRLRELITKAQDRALSAGDSFGQREAADTAAALSELLTFRTKLAEMMADPAPSPLEREVAELREKATALLAELRGLPRYDLGGDGCGYGVLEDRDDTGAWIKADDLAAILARHGEK